MKLKLIALAAVLAAAGSANAAVIDNGAGGNGGLFFNIWDANGSYSRNLGFSIDSFEAGLAAVGAIDLSFAADSTFTSFLGTANVADLKWNIAATDKQGAVRVLETFTAPKPVTTKTADIIRTLAGGVSTFASNLNLNGEFAAANSATYGSSSLAYAGGSGSITGATLNFSNFGTMATNSAANGLSFLRINANATGIAASTYNQYLDGASAVKVYLDGSNALHISAVTAVPEADTYAMLLAGLGLMGAIARRRNKKSA